MKIVTDIVVGMSIVFIMLPFFYYVHYLLSMSY